MSSSALIESSIDNYQKVNNIYKCAKSSNNAALTLSDGAVLQESYQVVFNTANPNSKRTLHAGPLK